MSKTEACIFVSHKEFMNLDLYGTPLTCISTTSSRVIQLDFGIPLARVGILLDSRPLVQSVGPSEKNGRYAHVLNWCEDPLHRNTTLIVKTFLSMIDFFLLMAILWDIYNKLVPEIID